MTEKPDINLFTKTLKCFLTGDEKQLYAGEVAALIQTERDLEDEKAAKTAEFNSHIKTVKGEYRDKAQRFRQGFEYREVECFVEKDFEAKRAITVRTDTDETIAERPLTADELQRQVFDNQVN